MAHFHGRHHRRGGARAPQPKAFRMPIPSQSSTEYHELDSERIRFSREGNQLFATVDDAETATEVTLFRLFPLSEPDGWLSVVATEDGREIGILPELRGFDKTTRETIEAELQRRYTVPVILRVLSCKERFDTVEWEVETDRGYRRFHSRGLRDNTQEPEPNRFILSDLHGNRYDIPDLLALDTRSRILLEQHL